MSYFVDEFCRLLVHLEKWPWDLTLDEFLDLPRHILEVSTTEEHYKREIWVVGRSGCGLINRSINMKYVGKVMNAVKNCGYFPACSAVVMLKIEARSEKVAFF